jgi:hypothetical protein
MKYEDETPGISKVFRSPNTRIPAVLKNTASPLHNIPEKAVAALDQKRFLCRLPSAVNHEHL